MIWYFLILKEGRWGNIKTEVEFRGILEDLTFKYFFSNQTILKAFVNSYFEYIKKNKRFYFSTIETQSNVTSLIRALKELDIK